MRHTLLIQSTLFLAVVIPDERLTMRHHQHCCLKLPGRFRGDRLCPGGHDIALREVPAGAKLVTDLDELEIQSSSQDLRRTRALQCPSFDSAVGPDIEVDEADRKSVV